jgi:hypothetical protein
MRAFSAVGLRCLSVALLAGCLGAQQPGAAWDFAALRERARALDAAGLSQVRAGAEAGEAQAQFVLGLAYEYGFGGLERDLAEALRWHTRAANQGVGLVESWVGDFYYDGIGVPVDNAEALAWYRRASGHGYPPATRFVADFHLAGLATARDPVQAASWYEKAAAQGDRRAAARLALLAPPCADDFCTVFRTLIISRDNGFRDLRGPRRIEPFKEVFTGTLKPAGAEACTLVPANRDQQTGAEYECVFQLPHEELVRRLRASLPDGWIAEVGGLAIVQAGPADGDPVAELSGVGLKIFAELDAR